MKIYTNLDNCPKNETVIHAPVDADVLVDLGAHDCMVEILELMSEIEKDNKKADARWTTLGALIGTALMRLELSLNRQLGEAAQQGEARTPT